ncbi:hypothetical protein DFQ30_009088 [Apophysomyces sp. BC1015]|nr:hypothetical protein DFQ30_009088 [Apophysomyces sp. BC1015]
MPRSHHSACHCCKGIAEVAFKVSVKHKHKNLWKYKAKLLSLVYIDPLFPFLYLETHPSVGAKNSIGFMYCTAKEIKDFAQDQKGLPQVPCEKSNLQLKDLRGLTDCAIRNAWQSTSR